MKKNKAILFIILVVINILLVQIFKIRKISILDILIIQSFLFSLSFLADVIQDKISKHKNITPSHFLAVNFLRILLCIIFLFPKILSDDKSDNIYIYNFFIAYFAYLFSDIIFKAKPPNKINI